MRVKIAPMLYEKDGVIMVWHYNAFLSYGPKPVEEKRVWLDPETANLKQVDLNAYFLENGTPSEDVVIEQGRLVGGLYAMALSEWEEKKEQEKILDRRA